MATRRRSANHTGTSYQRKDGRWEWRISLPDGSRKSFYGATEGEARNKARAATRNLEDGIDLNARALTVRKFMDDWVRVVAPERVRGSTLAAYQGHIDNHINPRIGAVKLVNLTPIHVEEMMAGMVRDGTSGSTANRVRATLRNALASAVKWRYVNINAAALADPRKEKPAPVKPLTTEQMESFLAFTFTHRHGPLFQFTAATGMRIGEVLGLRWSPDIDLEQGTARIQHTLLAKDYGQGRLGEPKTDRSARTIHLDEVALDALGRQRALVDQWRALACDRWQELDLVFPTTCGTYADNSKIVKSFQQLLEKLELPRQRLHDLRHYFATSQLANGAALHDVKHLLGHSTITLTSDTYGHWTEQMSKAAAQRSNRNRTKGVK